jgi:hypothetical protein
MKTLPTKFIACTFALAVSAHAQTIFVDFNQQNNTTTLPGFVIARLNTAVAEVNPAPTALGSIGAQAITLTVTNAWSSLSTTLAGVDASSAPTWFNSTLVNQDVLTLSTPGLSAGNTSGSFTVSGFLATDIIRFEVLGVRDGAGLDQTATFTMGSVASTSGANSTNYDTSTNAGGVAPTFGAAMIWELTGATSYTLDMTRLAGAPAISAMSITAIPEPSSVALLAGIGAGFFGFLRRPRR